MDGWMDGGAYKWMDGYEIVVFHIPLCNKSSDDETHPRLRILSLSFTGDFLLISRGQVFDCVCVLETKVTVFGYHYKTRLLHIYRYRIIFRENRPRSYRTLYQVTYYANIPEWLHLVLYLLVIKYCVIFNQQHHPLE